MTAPARTPDEQATLGDALTAHRGNVAELAEAYRTIRARGLDDIATASCLIALIDRTMCRLTTARTLAAAVAMYVERQDATAEKVEHEAVSMKDDRDADGWIAECRCGFRTAPYIKRSDARQTIDAHIRVSRRPGCDPLLIEAAQKTAPRRWLDRDGQHWQQRGDGLIALETETGLSGLFVCTDEGNLADEYGPVAEVTR